MAATRGRGMSVRRTGRCQGSGSRYPPGPAPRSGASHRPCRALGCPTGHHRTTGPDSACPQGQPPERPGRRSAHRATGHRRDAEAARMPRQRRDRTGSISPPLGAGDQLLRMPAGLFDPPLDLWWKLVLRLAALIAVASMLQLLILLKADDHGGRAAVMGEDRWLMAIPGAADQFADALTGLTDRHLTHTPNCTTAPRQPPSLSANRKITHRGWAGGSTRRSVSGAGRVVVVRLPG